MKVILKKDVENQGLQGDIIDVKNGYGRNYLIPKGLAVVATPSAVRAVKEERRQQEHKIQQVRMDAQQIADKLESMEILIPARVGEDNRIFGTITNQQVADALRDRDLDLDRRKIALDEEIRLTGVYTATVKLHPEVSAKVKVRVEPMS